MSVRLETLVGASAHRHLDGLARLRITVFREWPYLYDGDWAYEAEYLRAFSAASGAVIVAAWDADTLVGAATAAPLAAQAGYISAPFRAANLPLTEYCYFGESVLLSAYRGSGTGVDFFAAREAAARAMHDVKATTFCAVTRDAGDLRRPENHVPLDAFWRRRGYAPWPGMSCQIMWREIGAAGETAQQMQFWRKDLSS
jgi:GNAT superfamily N-acetyltransferase